MAASLKTGALQPDGRIIPEATFGVEHVANTIVYIASLPPDVAMLEVNIMYGAQANPLELFTNRSSLCRASKAPYVGRG